MHIAYAIFILGQISDSQTWLIKQIYFENLFPICPVVYAEAMIKFLDLQKNGEVQSMMDYLMLYNKVDSLKSVLPF